MPIESKPKLSMGQPIKRKEDNRFIQGRGNYLDDIVLPKMVYMSLVRSPYGHATINNIDTSAATKVPGVIAVITAKELAGAGLDWMPTLAQDKQMVLAGGKVLFQYQEVAAVFASSREAAADGVAAVQVDYSPLPAITDPYKAMAKGAPVLREDREKKDQPHLALRGRRSEDHARRARRRTGQDQTDDPLPALPPLAARAVRLRRRLQWRHRQAHVLRDLASAARAPHRDLAGLEGPRKQHPRGLPDIGGGFGNKVPVYPGYVCAIVGSLTLGVPVKWVETRTENLASTHFARDYWMETEIGATKDGKVTALKVSTVADHGAFDGAADPTKYPAGLFSICTGSYDFPTAFVEVDGYYTNKAPGGIAYRCSFRVTEASYCIERAMDILADELKMDPVDLRRKNFIPKEKFPYPSATGWTYDSGDYEATLDKALQTIDYKSLLNEQADARKAGKLFGIGVSTFTEIVGAGPAHNFDILGIKMFDSAEIRVHPTGSAIVRTGTKAQGQGHETTWAQIVAEELGLDVQNVLVEEGDTDTAPYGLGTYASRSTPVAGAAIAMAARKIREKAKLLAAHLLEANPADIEWVDYKFQVKGSPDRSKTMQDVAFAAYTNMGDEIEPGLEGTNYYNPPNLTFPNGAYICAVEIDKGTGEVHVRRFVAIDDCGNVINPMIVEGQIHGGLAEGFAIAFMQEIQYDSDGNNNTTNFTEYLVPTSHETPHWETGNTVTPSPHHPLGTKGVGESPNVGSPAAFANAVVDALSPLGVRHMDIPLTREKIWKILREKGIKG